MMRKTIIKSLSGAAFALALLPAAHADGDPFWSLAVGVPGLVANLGNVYPVAPQPVYVAPPPVQYAPAPGYYVAQPYAPAPPYYSERRRHWHGDHHEDHGDEGDR